MYYFADVELVRFLYPELVAIFEPWGHECVMKGFHFAFGILLLLPWAATHSY